MEGVIAIVCMIVFFIQGLIVIVCMIGHLLTKIYANERALFIFSLNVNIAITNQQLK